MKKEGRFYPKGLSEWILAWSLLILIIFLLLTLVFCRNARGAGAETEAITGSFVVSGYESKKYAVDDDKLWQINTGIASMAQDVTKTQGMILKVLVIGSADITGPSAENDPLSKGRAEPVAAILGHRLPEGTVVRVVPRGDADNARQVRVEWKYVSILVTPTPVAPVVPSKPKKEEKFDNFGWLVATICAAIVGIGVLLHLFKGRVQSEFPPLDKSGTKWLDVVANGEKYSVEVEFKDGKFISPFRSRSGARIIRDELKGIVDSLKGCLTKGEFSREKEGLIRQGIIKKI